MPGQLDLASHFLHFPQHRSPPVGIAYLLRNLPGLSILAVGEEEIHASLGRTIVLGIIPDLLQGRFHDGFIVLNSFLD